MCEDRNSSREEIFEIFKQQSSSSPARHQDFSYGFKEKSQVRGIESTRQLSFARRKRRFQVKPYILFVFDEAQEFIPDLTSSAGIDKKCSKQVETLLRQYASKQTTQKTK